MELIHGDCLLAMRLITQGSVDLVLTDPPYGTTQCKWDSIIPLESMWSCLKHVCKPTTPMLLFGTEPFSSALRMSNIKQFKYDWVWEKTRVTGFLNAKKQPLRNIELVSVFYHKQCKYNPQMTVGEPYKRLHNNKTKVYGKMKLIVADNPTGDRYPLQKIHFNSITNSERFHPTQKPVPLLEYLIKTYTNKGDTVLDFTMGSGSTGVACANLNRNFIGIEMDENHYNIAVERISACT